MKVKFVTLWLYLSGFFIYDTGKALFGFDPSFGQDLNIAFFILMAWVFERWFAPERRSEDAAASNQP